ncbi:MAG: DUF3347 domain-containing protein [Panacibacter sp.]
MKSQIHEYKKINKNAMSKNIILGLAMLTTVLAACNNSSPDKKDSTTSDAQTTNIPVDTSGKQVTATPETTATVSVAEILSGYLKMKNAFAKDNDKDAAAAGNEMIKTFASFNKTALTPDQAKIYNDIQDDAREHAEHIGSNTGNIKHQREHFDMLSKDMYQLVKTFGAGQNLYYDHCPMYNDGKGANWLSETKEIANPYLGKKMPTCGTIKEELK